MSLAGAEFSWIASANRSNGDSPPVKPDLVDQIVRCEHGLLHNYAELLPRPASLPGKMPLTKPLLERFPAKRLNGSSCGLIAETCLL